MAQTYDISRWDVKHLTYVGKLTNSASAATLARFSTYMTAKITEVFAIIHNGAGTNAASGWTIKKATTSIGAIAGTDAAGSIVAASLTDTAVTSTDVINIENTRSDTNMQGFLYVIWQETFAG